MLNNCEAKGLENGNGREAGDKGTGSGRVRYGRREVLTPLPPPPPPPQPIAQKQKSFIKDTTDFISFKEITKIGKDTILVSMDVSSLYTNIPQEKGTEIVCKAYDSFHNYNPPIPTSFLREMLGLILNENSFQFDGENYLQTHGTAMGTKMAVSFANIFSWLKLKQR